MSALMTLKDIHSAIGLQGLASGPSLFVEQDGQMSFLYGPAVARASLSARQAKELGLMTSGTSGQRSIGSSQSVALQSSLENRLRARTQTLGSTLYKLTWKPWITPSGLSRSRLRASVPRTSETGCIGWPTPTTRDWKDGASYQADIPINALLGRTVWLAGWPTPTANSSTGAGHQGRDGGLNIQTAVTLAGWPTPTSSMVTLGDMVQAMTAGNSQARTSYQEANQKFFGPVRLTVTGETLTGSAAGMESIAQLSPAHSRWLQGLPAEWDASAPTAMPSTRKQRKSSSKQ